MKESSRFLISLLSHLGHSLKNIETVFSEAAEELSASKDERLLAIGTDTNIALSKLSNISTLVGCLESNETEGQNAIILALRNLLILNCPDQETSSLLEIRTLSSQSFKIELPCHEKFIRELLLTDGNNVDLPISNILLIQLIYSLVSEQKYELYFNNKKLA